MPFSASLLTQSLRMASLYVSLLFMPTLKQEFIIQYLIFKLRPLAASASALLKRGTLGGAW